MSCQRLNILDEVQAGKWFAERQTFLEGFNRRLEKLLDASYFWWFLSKIY